MTAGRTRGGQLGKGLLKSLICIIDAAKKPLARDNHVTAADPFFLGTRVALVYKANLGNFSKSFFN